MCTRFLMSASLFTILLCGHAFSCEGSKVLFEDEFQDELNGWPLSDSTTIQNSTIRLAAKPGVPNLALIPGFTFTDADVCVEVRLAKAETPNATASLVFWGQDPNNYFTFQINPAGEYGAWRLNSNKWLTVVQEAKSPAIKPDEFTKLRVVLKGNMAEFYVNGQKVKQLRAQAPTGGWLIGLYSQSGSSEFKNLKVTSVP